MVSLRIGPRIDVHRLSDPRRQATALSYMEDLLRRYPPSMTYDSSGLALLRLKLEKVRAWAKPLDPPELLKSLGKARVSVFGEFHNEDAARQLIGRLLPNLRAAGYTHLAVEILSMDQLNLVKGFEAKKPGAESALRKVLADSYATGLMAEYAEQYQQLLVKAREAGLRLEPLTHPKVLDSIDQRLQTEPFFYDDADVRFRDIFMCLAIEGILRKNPRAKVAALVGLGHSDVHIGMPRILKGEFKRSTVSVAVTEREGEGSVFEINDELLRNIPVMNKMGWRIDDPRPKPGDWLVVTPPTASGADR